jgi:hypothetical protein
MLEALTGCRACISGSIARRLGATRLSQAFGGNDTTSIKKRLRSLGPRLAQFRIELGFVIMHYLLVLTD